MTQFLTSPAVILGIFVIGIVVSLSIVVGYVQSHDKQIEFDQIMLDRLDKHDCETLQQKLEKEQDILEKQIWPDHGYSDLINQKIYEKNC